MRLWRTQEIHDILAALVHAYDTLPWYAKWLLRGWREALATLGVMMTQRAEFEEKELGIEYKVWDASEITFTIASIYDGRRPRWDEALAAAALALCGQQEQQVLAPPEVGLAPPTVPQSHRPGMGGLDPEVWSEA